jgi:hypothetical protein
MNSSQSKVNSNQKSDFAGRTSQVACPFCGSTETEMLALFGQQLMTTQHYCNSCHSAFEAVKWEEANSSKPNAQGKKTVTGTGS